MPAPRVLFVTPECAPWIKTGGLADVSGALPPAVEACGVDVRVLLPAYPAVLAAAAHHRELARLAATPHFPAARLLETPLPSGVPALLVDCPALYARPGGPYQDGTGRAWPDNALRFGQLSRIAAVLAGASSPLAWRPDVVHCHDWQTGLVPAYLHFAPPPAAATLLTVHNLAFQGIFPAGVAAELSLPPQSFAVEGVEYYGSLSFLKAGLYYATALTTVSPTYADEIQHEPLGMGLQGLLAARREALTGILNGIDVALWDPAHDPLIPHRFDTGTIERKRGNKRALQERLGLVPAPDVPLAGVVSRLTGQKGIDLLLAVAAELLELPAQLVVLGTGEEALEQAVVALGAAHPGRVSATIGFDEALAHLIEAGADIFLMPSRFEPCGMNQMYSQRYGTVPVVRATGGLADSVVDCAPRTLVDGTATGFVFRESSPEALLTAIGRAAGTFRNRETWRALQRNGMARDFSWNASARQYVEIYERLRAR